MDSIERQKASKEICKFLHRYNALERYCFNVVSYHHNTIKVPVGLTLKERVLYIVSNQVRRVGENDYPGLEDFFESCFTCFPWVGTPEGGSYWGSLHEKWHKKITGRDFL